MPSKAPRSKRMARPSADPLTQATFRVGGETFVVVSWSIRDDQSARLTSAEREVAVLIAVGRSNQEIADSRGTTIRTVANQVASLLRKLGVPSRHHIARALSVG